MNILFLDLSTKSTGWSVGNEKRELISYGCVPVSGQPVQKRIPVMRDRVIDLIQQYNIEKVVIEDVFDEEDKVPNSDTQKKLTWLQGCVVVAIYEYNPKIQCEFLFASQWRKRIGIKTGRGIKREALKPLDMKYVFDTYGIQANDDVCDAICIHDAYYIPDKKDACAF